MGAGEGELISDELSFTLSPGTLAFIRPWEKHRIKEKTELTYLYISFYGDGADAILSEIGASEPVTTFDGYVQLIDFWMKSIRRINDSNALYVTDSVFTYTISHLVGGKSKTSDGGISAIISYIQENLSESELSLRTVAKMFYYSEKYFSALFVKSTGIKFTDYLNGLRINYATKLIDDGVRSVSELSSRCGFDNSYYFSKVFKKIKGVSPSEFIKSRASD